MKSDWGLLGQVKRDGFIYVLEDPRPMVYGRVRYVGQTTQARLNDRIAQHVCSARQLVVKSPVYDWLRMLDGMHLRPRVRTYRVVPLEDLDAEEIRCVALFRALYPDLLNLLDGGNGRSVDDRKVLSEKKKRYWQEHPEARQRRREAQLRFWLENPEAKAAFDALRFGRQVGAETRRKQSEKMRHYYKTHAGPMLGRSGPKLSLEGLERLRAAGRGKRHSWETRKKIGEKCRGHLVSLEAREQMSAARKRKHGVRTACADFRLPVTIGGVVKTLFEWGQEAQREGRIAWRNIRDRIYTYGWDPVLAITVPKGVRRSTALRIQGPMPTGSWWV